MSAKRASRPTRVARDAEPRALTDPREMRALAHPVRLALLEALTREGPLTATEAAEIVDESPANCSFHLRTLAKYGFVEEADGGTGRARPWRRVALGQSFSEEQADAATSLAASALSDVAHERTFKRIELYRAHRELFPEEWRNNAFASDVLTYVTPDEMQEIANQLIDVLVQYRERTLDRSKRPEGARPVQLAVFGTPLTPTASGN